MGVSKNNMQEEKREDMFHVLGFSLRATGSPQSVIFSDLTDILLGEIFWDIPSKHP